MEQVDILRAACCIAGQDETVCRKERRLLERIAHHAGVGGASLDAMIHRAENDEGYFKEQFEVLGDNLDRTFKILLSIAMADGRITDGERSVLEHFSERFGITQERFKQLISAAEARIASGPSESP